MTKVFPSQIVSLIDKMFPWAEEQKENDKHEALYRENSPQLAAILTLTENIPDELLVLPEQAYVELQCSLAAIRDIFTIWPSRDQKLDYVRGLPKLSPVSLIRRALAQCPDAHPAPSTQELSFIPDSDFRVTLRQDLSSTNQALANGEWKAATVLGGSVLEALLLWRLNQYPSAVISSAIDKLRAAGIRLSSEKELEKWHLADYIEMSEHLGIISKSSATQARLAKDFRNLIHPGREVRERQSCDRGTALTAVAAVELVVRDLSSISPSAGTLDTKGSP